MTNLREGALLVGVGIAILGATSGITATVLHYYPGLLSTLKIFPDSSSSVTCKTIATDPNPPLNVRSSPVSAPDNIVGRLRNGTRLEVVDENQGWLRIVSPVEGWVYKDLTVTSCIPATATQVSADWSDNGMKVLQEATEAYQAGNLSAAIALAQTIPAQSSTYQAAQGAINQWQQDWKTAEAEFEAAQTAFQAKQWQEVLNKVRNFPGNRYWRARLTPMVEEAIKQQNANKER
ncbi:SH3 domain-containing protein [Leptothermofonsia sichuanensis E412]|uniref:SH3 domain-containing protein n=1 Tax=Leptothermofonsia sichuanensis TaxID=2917832 RepID=UPI001CA602B6|nr:SH3 domain-containing protein [Leptothermofonsia sichuanensis]QZZ22847.1 SH3 domain-containing protein [Leptothermofonsia sichuanensis E412]